MPSEQQQLATMVADIHSIKETLQRFESSVKEHVVKEEKEREKVASLLAEESKALDARIRQLENWKIAFVAKFSVYSAIALFMGSVMSQLAIWILTK